MPTRRTPRHRASNRNISPDAVYHFQRWQLSGEGYYDLLAALNLPPWTNIEDPGEKCPYDKEHASYDLWHERRTEESLELFRELEAAARD